MTGNRGLVTQSLIRNADRAVGAPDGLDLAVPTDLCSLCEALVLLDDVRSLETADPHAPSPSGSAWTANSPGHPPTGDWSASSGASPPPPGSSTSRAGGRSGSTPG